MREVKFRVWNTIIKEMSCNYSCEIMGRNLNDHFKDDQVIFMQYSGLKDKNGKEICEGDIIKWNIDRSSLSPGSPVFFSRGCFYVEVCGNWKLLNTLNQECEIIGNTYENRRSNAHI